MSNKEKEIKKSAEELSEDSLGNVAGGYVSYSPLGGDFAEAYGYSKKTGKLIGRSFSGGGNAYERAIEWSEQNLKQDKETGFAHDIDVR